MDAVEVEQWLAMWEPQLLGLPPKVAAAQVAAAGLTPRITHYIADGGV